MMEVSERRPLRLPSLVSLLLPNFITPNSAVYIYVENTNPKCFHKELPKDILVVG